MAKAIGAVVRHALANKGVVTRREALALGISPRTLDRQIADGILLRVATGVYALPGAMESTRSTLEAATRALGAVVSHQSAARIHGADLAGPELVVSVPHRKTHRFSDVIVHQLTDISMGEIRSIHGLPVTSPERSVVDLAAVLKPRRLGRCLDQLVTQRATTYEKVADQLDRVARKGKPGVRNLRALLGARLDRNGPTESVLESRLIDLIEMAGLPIPESQFRPTWLSHISGRVDFAYPEHRLILEADSRAWHGDETTFQADRQRDNTAQLAGWRVLRFTWADVNDRSDYVIASIRRALGLSVSL